MVDCFLSWVENHPALAYWVQGGAIFATGLFAWRAGSNSYNGAKLQANELRKQTEAIRSAAEEQKNADIRQITLSIAVEVEELVKMLAATHYLATRNNVLVVRKFFFIERGCPIYDSNPQAIAKLPNEMPRKAQHFYSGLKSEWEMWKTIGIDHVIAGTDFKYYEDANRALGWDRNKFDRNIV